MRAKRVVIEGDGTYHCMTRTVNGERLFKTREKEMLRRMLRQVADFSGVRVLTYCILTNHFHVLVQVPTNQKISDAELIRRYKVLYPKPTKYQAASADLIFKELENNGPDAEAIRERLLQRMGDVSQFMKTLKQRFSVWYNRSNQRFGTLWAERFKSVLVEGYGNPLQTIAAYIDLNAVRAGLVEDPKDYRFCGYAEAVAGESLAKEGLLAVWRDLAGSAQPMQSAMKLHRSLIFGQVAATAAPESVSREQALAILESDGELPLSSILRCRVRYFSDGAILGSSEFVSRFKDSWQKNRQRKYPPKVNPLRGAKWGDLNVIHGMRSKVFG